MSEVAGSGLQAQGGRVGQGANRHCGLPAMAFALLDVSLSPCCALHKARRIEGVARRLTHKLSESVRSGNQVFCTQCVLAKCCSGASPDASWQIVRSSQLLLMSHYACLVTLCASAALTSANLT